MSQPAILAGLIGRGIQLSRTPALHEHEGDAQHLRYLYRLIDADQLQLEDSALAQLLDAAQHTGFTGLNITYPFKQAILPLLDELSDEARGIGAVNTVVLKDGKRVGHNTDCLGFAEGLRRGLPDVSRRRVVQMGAGGAGSAVAHALLSEGSGNWCCSKWMQRAPRLWLTTSMAISARVARYLARTSRSKWPKPTAWSIPRQWAWPSCQARRSRWSCCTGAVGG